MVNWTMVVRGLAIGSSWFGHWVVVDWPSDCSLTGKSWDWPSDCSLTGEARMFRLDEVGNYRKILIEGELVLPPHPYKSMFCRCFSMFCRGEAD